jgi:hypothetical protein
MATTGQSPILPTTRATMGPSRPFGTTQSCVSIDPASKLPLFKKIKISLGDQWGGVNTCIPWVSFYLRNAKNETSGLFQSHF